MVRQEFCERMLRIAENFDQCESRINDALACLIQMGDDYLAIVDALADMPVRGASNENRVFPLTLDALKAYYRNSTSATSPADGLCGYAETKDGHIYAVVIVQSLNNELVAVRNIHLTDNKPFLFGEEAYNVDWRFWLTVPSAEDKKEAVWYEERPARTSR